MGAFTLGEIMAGLYRVRNQNGVDDTKRLRRSRFRNRAFYDSSCGSLCQDRRSPPGTRRAREKIVPAVPFISSLDTELLGGIARPGLADGAHAQDC